MFDVYSGSQATENDGVGPGGADPGPVGADPGPQFSTLIAEPS